MPRFFNVAGPCTPADHYMLPPERRLPGIRELVDGKLYFVIHAPRQVGKTTCFRALAHDLTASGRYAAVHTSCETGQAARNDAEAALPGILTSLMLDAAEQLANYDDALLPPPPDDTIGAHGRLQDLLTRWSQNSPLPVVVFFDEIDALYDDVLISVLRQLRAGYVRRPTDFPQSVALIGLRDVRDYKASVRRHGETLGTSSPFNIKVESLTIRNFTADEVMELYSQHTAETGQAFTPEAMALAFHLTDGQPWLVNALARQVTLKDVTDRTVPIEPHHIERARDILIERRDTHLDSLIERLREDRVRRVISPMLAGDLVLGDRIDDDIAFVEDLGLVKRVSGHLQIANPIYQEVIPRALASITQYTIPHPTHWYLDTDGRLDLHKLLEGFIRFWREHGDALLAHQPYPEIAPHLVLMAFLQRVVNGGGTIVREYAVGSGRLDICVRWPWKGGIDLHAIELKVRTDRKNPLGDGLEQLADYMRGLSVQHGTLVIFDRRSNAPPVEERGEIERESYDGLEIEIVWL